MTINNNDSPITLENLGTLYPVEEESLKKINLEDHMQENFVDALRSVMSFIIEHNTQAAKEKNRAYRIGYYIRNALHVFTPDYEWMNPSKNILILSIDGMQIGKNKVLEMLDIHQVLGIGSDLFTMENFLDYQMHEYNSKKIPPNYIDEINSMREKWMNSKCSQMKSVINFMNDIKKINLMSSYNRREFYEAKRNYVADFISFLKTIILYPDNSISDEDVKILLEYYKDYDVVNTNQVVNPESIIKKSR